MQQVFYVTLDPERALGVEDLFPSYHIIYSDPSQLVEPIISSGVDVKNISPDKSKAHNTAKIINNPELNDYLKLNAFQSPNILVFKNDEQIKLGCIKNNYNLLNPDPSFAKRFENKIEFSKFLTEINQFRQPDYELFEKVSDLNYVSIEQKFGNSFVIQFFFGHSGNSTFFINSLNDLNELKESYPLRKGKIVKKIDGTPYTINACVTKFGVVIGGISEQITGIKQLTPSEGGTVGNDYSQRHLNDSSREDMIRQTMKFGEIIGKEGYKGIFGLDFIFDQKNEVFYLIEANMRQTASCSYTSYLQRLNKQVPIMLWHILELLDHDYQTAFEGLNEDVQEWINNEISRVVNTGDLLKLNIEQNQPMHASQLFFRNIKSKTIKMIEPFPSGSYRMRGRMPQESAAFEEEEEYSHVFRLREDGWSTLCFIGRAYNIIEASKENGFFINAVPEDAVVQSFGEIGRIQVLESAFSSPTDTNVNGWMIDVVNAIYENTTTIETE